MCSDLTHNIDSKYSDSEWAENKPHCVIIQTSILSYIMSVFGGQQRLGLWWRDCLLTFNCIGDDSGTLVEVGSRLLVFLPIHGGQLLVSVHCLKLSPATRTRS